LKLALAFGCLLLMIAGLFDLEPFRPRAGRVQALKRRGSAGRAARH
jgi:hypothetical protein